MAVAAQQPEIIRATEDDLESLANLVAEAFVESKAAMWLSPDPAARVPALVVGARILLLHALRRGQIDQVADGSGVAVWYHRDQPSDSSLDIGQRLEGVCGESAERFRAMWETFESHHPAQPHHHLGALAVRPGFEGRGRGTALLRHHHRILDASGTPSYLEAFGIRAANICDREGYRPVAQPFSLPDGTLFYPMWRIPGSGAAGRVLDGRLARRPVMRRAPSRPNVVD
jgi:GNAT superfamily N-acetyltransferase